MKILETLRVRCFVVWLIAMTGIGMTAVARAVPLSNFTRLTEERRLSWWEVVVFSATLSVVGAYFAIAPTKLESTAARAGTLSTTLRFNGWVFLIVGVIVFTRAILELTSE